MPFKKAKPDEKQPPLQRSSAPPDDDEANQPPPPPRKSVMRDPDADLDDDNPIEVNEPVEVGDLDDQTDSSAAIEPAKRVPFVIKKASVRVSQDSDKNDLVKSLHVECKVWDTGVDGEGLYAGKVFFPEFILAFDLDAVKANHKKQQKAGKKTKDFNEKWWTKEARYPTKLFLIAIEAVSKVDGKLTKVTVDDAFCEQCKGVEFLADITKVKDAYRGDGFFKNELKNFLPVSAAKDEDDE